MNEVTDVPRIKRDVKNWLIFFRAHTVVLEAPLAILGAGIALGTLVDPQILLWAIFGILYHLVGYGMNSYTDWIKGFDKDDPNKQHHPLNTGGIKEDTAKLIVIVSTVTLALYGFIIGGSNIVSAVFVVAMFGFGAMYNWVGKYTSHKYIPIAIAHTLVFVFPFVALGGTVSFASIALVGSIFIHNVYQIAISGDIKDLNQDESSLLQDYGVRIENHPDLGEVMMVTPKAIIASIILTSAEIALAVAVLATNVYVHIQGRPLIYGIAILVFFICGYLVIYYKVELTKSQEYDRDKMIRSMSLKEMSGYSMIILSVSGMLDPALLLLLIFVMLLYVRSMSEFMWSSSISPKV